MMDEATTLGGRRAGFTLVELLAAIAVILILVGLTIGLSSGVAARRAEARAQTDLAVLAQGLERCRSLVGDYPWVGGWPLAGDRVQPRAAGELLRTLTGHRAVDPARPALRRAGVLVDAAALDYAGPAYDPNGPADPAGAYPVDPWGNPYLYFYNPSYPQASSAWKNPGYLLLSAGPDGRVSLPGADVPRTGVVDAAAYAADPVNADNVVGKL